MPEKIATAGTVKSAERVLLLFELLSSWDREMSHAEIAEALQIPKSSLTQLLKNLVSRDWLAYEAHGKTYALGSAFTRLAKRAGLARDLVTLSEPVLIELTAKTLESSALNLLKGEHAEVACAVMGPQRLVSHLKHGDVAPLHATSGAKAILAYLPKDMQDDYIRRVTFEPRTPATITNARALRKNLAQIVEEGFAYSFEEWTPGIVGMAKPILDQGMRPVGAINLAIPAVRFNPKAAKLFQVELTRAVDAVRRQILPS